MNIIDARAQKVEKICAIYDSRKYSEATIAEQLGTTVKNISSLLTACNYYHTIKNNSTQMSNRSHNPILFLEQYPWLDDIESERLDKLL